MQGQCSLQNARNFIGRSEAFNSIRKTIDVVAPRLSPVIINGQTGTGKEMVARQIHLNSSRSDKVFIPVDCTALNGQIFESQLFGHAKGAFTGAFTDTLGFFRAADTGTIFLDEIGEIELEMQAKLLRVLQESAVTPVGSTKSHPVDVRVICATNRNLKQMVREGTFRADLYFRLNVIKIEVPPLQDRHTDIILLAEHFLQKQADLYQEPMKKLSESAREILMQYPWPGNVRELANVMEHAYIVSKSDVIETDDLPLDIVIGDTVLPEDNQTFTSFEQLQRRMVVAALEKSKGKKLHAAKILEIDHRKLGKLVDRYNLMPTWK